jgi:hypothetical protein
VQGLDEVRQTVELGGGEREAHGFMGR